MSFISRVMRFLLWVLVLWWAWALLRRAVGWMLRDVVNPRAPDAGKVGGTAEPAKIASRRLVRDPVCGVHIAEERAIAVTEGNEVVNFCSVACRDQYLSGGKKFAAHG
jgi:YHS domain-containing protein